MAGRSVTRPPPGEAAAGAALTAELEAFSALLGELYAGLLKERPWDDFLRALSGYVEAQAAVLMLLAPDGASLPVLTATGSDPQGASRYLANYFALDPFKGLPEGQVTSVREFLAGRRIVETDFYKEFMAFSGGDQILGVDLRADNGFEARLRVTRPATAADFGAKEREALQRLVPHLRCALALFGRNQGAALEQGLYRSAIEQLAVGTVILDRRGTILRANAVAERLLAARDGMRRAAGGRLVLEQAEAARSLQQMLNALQQVADPAAVAPVRLRLALSTADRELTLVAKPTLGPAYLRAGGGAALALFIAESGQAPAPASEAIAELFGLTPREAALASHLATGASLRVAAGLLGVSYNTARTHLRAIFAKTGATRQGQLLLLLRQVGDLGGATDPA